MRSSYCPGYGVQSYGGMLRRRAVSLLLGALAKIDAPASAGLNRFLNPSLGSALLLDIRARRLLAINNIAEAGRTLAPPGSTLKPLVLSALLSRKRLGSDPAFHCPGRLLIGNRRFDCTHPVTATLMTTETALAYSCNCFVARSEALLTSGSRQTVCVRASMTGGPFLPSGAMVPQGSAGCGTGAPLAYRQLAITASRPEMHSILEGLEGAVEFGTARNARIAGVTVAGKTGSTRNAAGESIAWFAGFLPSRDPEVVVTVMLSGRSGGADAAPVARQILEGYRAGHL